MINLSFENVAFPELFKLSIVKPIFKKGDKSDLSNYRRITLISTYEYMAKIFGKCMFITLMDYCTKFSIIKP